MTTYYMRQGGTAANKAAATGPGSTASACMSVATHNGETFSAGDVILLCDDGGSFDATIIPPSSGSSGSPITYRPETGDSPVVDGADTVNCISVNGKNYLTFEDLELTQGLDSGLYLADATYIEVVDCDMHDCGNDNLLIYTDCHHITVTRGNYYNGYQRVGGATITGIEITNGAHDVLIDGATCYSNTGAGMGISIHSHVGTTMPYNIIIRNVDCYGNSNHGINIVKQDNAIDADRNIVIEDSQFHDNTQEGVRCVQAAGEYPIGITFRRCSFIDNTRYAGYLEGDDIRFEYCLIHEGRMLYVQKFKRLIIYNCTFYLTTWANYGPLQLDPWGADARTDGVTVRNCIFSSPDAATYIAWCDDFPNIDFDYNLYDRANETDTRWRYDGVLYNYANWKIQSGGDAHSLPVQSALFVDPANDDFALQPTSPCINAGVDVGLNRDYAGKSVPQGSAPDIGAYEWIGAGGFAGMACTGWGLTTPA